MNARPAWSNVWRVWLRQHGLALRLAARRLLGAPVSTALSLLTIGVALALPLAGVMVFAQAQQLARSSSALPQVSVFMKLHAESKVVSDVESRLNQLSGVKSVQFLPREATLKRMQKSEGLADVIDVLPRNPFPDAFVITPANTGAAEMEQLATELRAMPQIEHVQIDSAWVRRLNAMLRLAEAGLGVLSLLLGVGLVAITFNTIRLQVLTQRNEVEISQLLGATDAFIRRPFYYFGTLQGLLGGIVAWLIVAAAMMVLRAPLNELATLYGLDLTLALPDVKITAGLLALAAALGWMGTALSLSQHLRRSTIF
jgi:cell division transport system permease protein